jgi:hypothetical protein
VRSPEKAILNFCVRVDEIHGRHLDFLWLSGRIDARRTSSPNFVKKQLRFVK